MLGVFAEFETNLRRERQLEGITAAKARGVYKGRKPSIGAGEVRRLLDDEKLGPAAIARRLGIGRASVYRLLGKQTGDHFHQLDLCPAQPHDLRRSQSAASASAWPCAWLGFGDGFR